MIATELIGLDRSKAMETICQNHYTRSVPSGKSHYVQFEDAIVVWTIPANKNIAKFILGWPDNVWELSRLWAPDGHAPNLLTRAISAARAIQPKIVYTDDIRLRMSDAAKKRGISKETRDKINETKRRQSRESKERNQPCLNL